MDDCSASATAGGRRRRQVDPDRPPARSTRSRSSRTSSRRSSAPAATAGTEYTNLALLDRRPAGRARAGHHDRRGLPLLRHAAAASSSSPTPRAHPVHPEHGHRRLDRRPGDHPGRRAQGRPGAVAGATPSSDAAAGAPPRPRAINKMDLVDYAEERFEEIREEFTEFASKLNVERPRASSRSRPCTATTWSPLREHAVVRRARRCSTTWSTSTSPPTATWSTCASRCST